MTVIGCSFSVGVGLVAEKDDPENYVNLIKEDLKLKIKNLSKAGNSNYNIFITALNELKDNNPDYLLIQWSAFNRLWVYPGPDAELQLSAYINSDFKYRDIFFSKKELQKIATYFFTLNHDYKSIISLVEFCDLINFMAKKTRVIFVNGLLPLTADLFDKKAITNPALNFSNYTKEILEFDSRSDEELSKLFLELSNATSSLNMAQWPNITESLMNMRIDFGSDGSHPGYKSHKLYATMITNYLKKTYV